MVCSSIVQVRNYLSIKYRCAIALFVVCCLSGIPTARADSTYTPVYHPKLNISRVSGTITIDGVLDDEGWQGAAKAENFAEHNPGDQTKPEVDTEVLLTYDDNNLYVAWLCYDDPEEVRSSFCERDHIFSGDYVILCIDTYGEATHAYEIAANPHGIPGDLLFSTQNGEDISYDMIFESSGRINDSGWVVEMAIPFESLRFPDRNEQVWRVDFWRNRPRESRFQYSWAAYDRDQNCWACQWGTVTGISDVEPGAGFELLPAVVASQSASLNQYNHLDNSDIMGDIALGVTYDVSSELTTEATINPDFSQVETDIAQLDVNTTFALFYPEKRPFFQEGSDLFDTYYEAVYTRSINDPIAAGKITFRKGSNSMAYLSAYDQHSVIILPFEEQSRFVENGKSYSNVLRFRHDLGEASHLGLIATDRRFQSGGSGSLGGIDGQIRLSESNSLVFQFLGSYTREVDNIALLPDSSFNSRRFGDNDYTAGLDGESFMGHGLLVNLGRSTGNYWGGMEYSELSPTFRADNGFEPSNNRRMVTSWIGGILRFEDNSTLENIEGDIYAARKWNFDGVKKDEWINSELEVQFRAAQTWIQFSYMRSNELFGGTQFNNIWQTEASLVTHPSGSLSLSGDIGYGHRIARGDLVMGKQFGCEVEADIRPIDRMLISTSYDYIHSNDLNSDKRLFSQSVWWSRLSLQLSREFSMRLVLQHNDRTNSWDVDPLLTYRINSLTVFYVGSTHDYRNLTLDDHGNTRWTLTERQFFLKLQYLFQL
jgi:hypothetical protein